ncbi:MAG: hypothetical protein LW700_01320 [Gemmataceae bacterium]|jgi:hypothetical protein|nr:hypothetical protein [Gemmataceae bacterium]
MTTPEAELSAKTEAVALLAAARMPLLLATAEATDPQRQLANGLLELGALLLTDSPDTLYQGNILNLASPGPDLPLPEQAWKHAEEACKKTDLALVFEPVSRDLATLAELVAWSGTRVLSVASDNCSAPAGTDSIALDLQAALDWLQAVRDQKENNT